MKKPKRRHPSKKRRHPSVLLAFATLTTTTALAHPGINDHHDVMAAAHDLGHASSAHPALAFAGLILGLTVAAVAVYRVKTKHRNSVREKPELKTIQNS